LPVCFDSDALENYIWQFLVHTPYSRTEVADNGHQHTQGPEHDEHKRNASSRPGADNLPHTASQQTAISEQGLEHMIRQWPGNQVAKLYRPYRYHTAGSEGSSLHPRLHLRLPDYPSAGIHDGRSKVENNRSAEEK
jgi:hypothetical protein